MDPTATLQAVRQWLVADRLELVFRLWDPLVEDGWQPEPSDDLLAELDRRLTVHERNPTEVRTWEQIRVRRPS